MRLDGAAACAYVSTKVCKRASLSHLSEVTSRVKVRLKVKRRKTYYFVKGLLYYTNMQAVTFMNDAIHVIR